MITSRRSLFGFGAALLAAPAIVRVASIMPVSVPKLVTSVPWQWVPQGLTVERINKFKGQILAHAAARQALERNGEPVYRVFVPYGTLST